MPKKYPSEQRDGATRMVLDRLKEYPSGWAAAQGLGSKLGVGRTACAGALPPGRLQP
jgi:transposase